MKTRRSCNSATVVSSGEAIRTASLQVTFRAGFDLPQIAPMGARPLDALRILFVFTTPVSYFVKLHLRNIARVRERTKLRVWMMLVANP